MISIRNTYLRDRAAMLMFLMFAVALPAAAQTVASRQTLDRVFAYSGTAALNMAFGNAYRPPDFTNLGVAGTNFLTCTVTAVGGLYCLDGRIVRNWPNPLQPTLFSDPVNCSDPALGLETRKGDPCTAMTVDQNGTIWLAAKKRNAHSVIKVIPKGTACPDTTWATISGGARCAKELYFGRPLLIDLVAVDGDLAKSFRPCPACAVQSGVVGIEERKNAVFFPDPAYLANPLTAQPVTVVSSRDWGLSGGELLQDVALLQLPGGTYPVETTLLATTSSGRILARNTSLSGSARPVFNIPGERIIGSASCNASAQQYGMRASPTTGIVYVSDRNFCQVVALEPNVDSANFTTLVNLVDGIDDLTLSTADGSGTFGVIGLTIAPGISIDLTNCRVNCAIINSPGGEPAAQLSDVQLAFNSASGATVFQVKDIPDCRYAAQTGFPAAKRAVCDTKAGVVIDPEGASVDVRPDGTLDSIYPAAAMQLNVTPLLPDDVVLAFNASGLRAGGLPPLLVSRQYRAQARTNYVFEALFVLPQPNVRYINTFSGEFDVPELEGLDGSLGCTPGTGNLLAWDVATYVSELFVSVGGRHVDTLANVGCGSIRIGAGRLSLLPYDLQVNPDTWGPTGPSSAPTAPVLTAGNDAVFARLLQSLYGDLGYVQRELACKPADAGAGSAPLSNNLCNSLTSTWGNGKQVHRQVHRRGIPAEVQRRRRELPVVHQPADELPQQPASDDGPAGPREPARRAEGAHRSDPACVLHALRAVDSVGRVLPRGWHARLHITLDLAHRGRMMKCVMNLDEVKFEDWPPMFQPQGETAERFGSRLAPVGAKIGARLLGYNITVVQPGKRAFPLHNHHANEEMFFILSGSGELRVGSERTPLRAGDFIACPPGGLDTAHQIFNTGSEELRYLAVSTRIFPEVVEYPDSGKFAVSTMRSAAGGGAPQPFRHVGREGTGLDYWDGE